MASPPTPSPTRPVAPSWIRDRMARRVVLLGVGLVLFGVSLAMLVRAELGVGPWDVFHQGLASRTPLSFGTIVIVVSAAVLLLWIPLRERPGLGTIANAIVVGLVVDASLLVIDTPVGVGGRTALLVAGIVLNGVATGLYIGAGLGSGPRDGLMTGLAARGHGMSLARTGVELVVLAGGWLLGGTVGIGTVVFALAIGPLAQVTLGWFTLAEAARPVEVGDGAA